MSVVFVLDFEAHRGGYVSLLVSAFPNLEDVGLHLFDFYQGVP